ncbi:MAG: hypothetical protein JO281_13405, partial [Pseudonocardiales bacterium]|nr:hypothetical protein [Pseudonocardiales bacterium]
MGRANETVLVRPWVCRRGPVSVGRAFGTLSELLQGALPEDGPEFLVTFPIGAWREATL